MFDPLLPIVKEDGTLVLAGSAYEENQLPKTVKYVGQNGSKRIQTIFVVSTVIGELANISCTFFYNPRCDFSSRIPLYASRCPITATACILVMMFILFNRMNRDDEEENDGITDTSHLS